MLTIRKATPADAEELYNLYQNHLTANLPKEPQDMAVWRERLARFERLMRVHITIIFTKVRKPLVRNREKLLSYTEKC